MEILLFCIAAVGMTHILVDGSIFQWLRDLPDKLSKKINNIALKWILDKLSALIHCHMCSGWWCGGVIGLLVFDPSFRIFFVTACAGSFLSYAAALYLNYLESQTYITDQALVNALPKDTKEESGK